MGVIVSVCVCLDVGGQGREQNPRNPPWVLFSPRSRPQAGSNTLVTPKAAPGAIWGFLLIYAEFSGSPPETTYSHRYFLCLLLDFDETRTEDVYWSN